MVAIVEAVEKKLEIGFMPQPAIVKGFVYFDEHRRGNWPGQQYINSVPVDFYRGQERFVCVETCYDADSGQNGYFEQEY